MFLLGSQKGVSLIRFWGAPFQKFGALVFISQRNAVWIWGFLGPASVEESFGFRGTFCWIEFIGAIERLIRIACK